MSGLTTLPFSQSRSSLCPVRENRRSSCLSDARKGMRIIPTSLLVLLFSLAAQAQNNLPDAPAHAGGASVPLTAATSLKPVPNTVVFHRKIFWPLVAACGTAVVLDAQMSHNYETSHPNSLDSSAWLVGRRPSLGRYYATFIVLDGGVALAGC